MTRILAVLALWGAAGMAAPFPHKLHLEFQPDCASCHPAAASSTSPGDNLLPDPKVCRPCHDSAAIGPPATTRVAHFSHQRHSKLGNIAVVLAAAIDKKDYLQPPGDIRRHLNGANPCEACHRGLEDSLRVSPENLPNMADCLVCHNRIDNPFSCEQCHLPSDNLKPSNHVAGFMSAHSSPDAKLDKASCTICHGREFHCLGCH